MNSDMSFMNVEKELDLLRREIFKLQSQLASLEAGYDDPLALPPGYHIVDITGGRAEGYKHGVRIISTVSHMDAVRHCWANYLGVDKLINQPYQNLTFSFSWRKKSDGWKFWFTYQNRSDEWIASDDFLTIRECLQAAVKFESENK
jgi:hypothetical protein